MPSATKSTRPARSRWSIYDLVAFVSAGAAGMHELVWARLAGYLVGNTSWAIAIALASFMLGSGLGTLLYARGFLNAPGARAAYGAVEVALGVSAVLGSWFLLHGGLLSSAVGLSPSTLADAVDLSSALILIIPAGLIGLTYPLLVKASLNRHPRAAPRLYGWGLLGAMGGMLVGALFVVPRIGYEWAAVAAAAVNITIGIVFLLTRGKDQKKEQKSARAVSTKSLVKTGTLESIGLFAVASMLGMGAQVLWNRALVPYAGVSVLTFAAIVATYVGSQGLAFSVNRRSSHQSNERAAFMLMAAVPVMVLGLLAAVSVPFDAPRDEQPVRWILESIITVAVAVLPGAFVLGLAQFQVLSQTVATGKLQPRTAALIVGVGTLAGGAWTLIVEILLLPLVEIRGTLVLLALLPVAIALRLGRRASMAAVVSAGLVVAFAASNVGPGHFLGRSHDAERILYVNVGRQDTVAVVEHDRQPVEPGVRRVVSNGVSYSGDSIYAQRYMRLLAHLPALSTPHRRRALVICIGTGTTAAALLTHPFEHVDGVDISDDVVDTLSYFRRVNADFMNDPRFELHVADGLRHLRTTRSTYDVITLEPPPPRAPGGSILYSKELYSAARSRLSDRGVVAQWLPLHGLSAWEASAIVAAFIDVFPDGALHLAERNEAILLGGGERTAPADVSEEARADLARIGFTGQDARLDTLWVDADGLSALARDTPPASYAWPGPEFAPLGRPGDTERLDVWAERASRHSASASGRFARIMSEAVAPFIRVREGVGTRADRSRVTDAMVRLLARHPEDPYVQHMFGFGPLLSERLEELDVPADLAERAVHLMNQQQQAAGQMLSDR